MTTWNLTKCISDKSLLSKLFLTEFTMWHILLNIYMQPFIFSQLISLMVSVDVKHHVDCQSTAFCL